MVIAYVDDSKLTANTNVLEYESLMPEGGQQDFPIAGRRLAVENCRCRLRSSESLFSNWRREREGFELEGLLTRPQGLRNQYVTDFIGNGSPLESLQIPIAGSSAGSRPRRYRDGQIGRSALPRS